MAKSTHWIRKVDIGNDNPRLLPARDPKRLRFIGLQFSLHQRWRDLHKLNRFSFLCIRINREGDGRLHRRLSGKHSRSTRLSWRSSWLHEEFSAGISADRGRGVECDIQRHRTGCDAGNHSLAESTYARVLPSLKFISVAARWYAGWCYKLSWVYLGTNWKFKIEYK